MSEHLPAPRGRPQGGGTPPPPPPPGSGTPWSQVRDLARDLLEEVTGQGGAQGPRPGQGQEREGPSGRSAEQARSVRPEEARPRMRDRTGRDRSGQDRSGQDRSRRSRDPEEQRRQRDRQQRGSAAVQDEIAAQRARERELERERERTRKRLRRALASRDSLRQAILLREVLGPPAAMWQRGDGPGGYWSG